MPSTKVKTSKEKHLTRSILNQIYLLRRKEADCLGFFFFFFFFFFSFWGVGGGAFVLYAIFWITLSLGDTSRLGSVTVYSSGHQLYYSFVVSKVRLYYTELNEPVNEFEYIEYFTPTPPPPKKKKKKKKKKTENFQVKKIFHIIFIFQLKT